MSNPRYIGRPPINRRTGRGRRPAVRAACALAALIAFSLPSVPAAAASPDEPRLATTGNDSELRKAVPVATQQYAGDRVAMSLGPEELPRLENGDRLRVSGEVQVSTTCVKRSPRCVGRRYDFSPWVSVRLVLAAEPSPSAPGMPLSGEVTVRCKQQRPNRNHHCTLVLPNLETGVPDTAALPCPANACYVNMIVGAWARKARPGNRVVLGGDRPDGEVAQDKGRLNVIVQPGDGPQPIDSTSALLVNNALPFAGSKRMKRRVVHSVEIPTARKDDILAFDASYLATIDHLPFNTFIGSRVIVADSPVSTDPTGISKEVALFGGDATEGNGFNCTQGRSGYASPCTVVKSGATRITRDSVDEQGQSVPLYVNLVAAAAPKLTIDLKPRHLVNVSPSSGLRVLRFPAS